MNKTTILGLALAFGLATAANAAVVSVPTSFATGPIIKVGEGCGPGFWRGPKGGCNPFTGPYGNNRGTTIECPPGYHIGPERERCWPNRG